jgi:hypothetical protein
MPSSAPFYGFYHSDIRAAVPVIRSSTASVRIRNAFGRYGGHHYPIRKTCQVIKLEAGKDKHHALLFP